MSDETDALYALEVDHDCRASKAFRWVGDDRVKLVASYSMTRWYPLAEKSPPIGGIRELADVVRFVVSNGSAFVIRGRLRCGAERARNVNRRCREESDDPHWKAHPEGRRWLMIDLDDLEAPDGFPAAPNSEDLRRAVRYARGRLPECFNEVTTFYQWSSSAGLQRARTADADEKLYRTGWGELRLHLWFWCNRRASSQSLRRWLKAYRTETGTPVDSALYNPVQPHYVAPPDFTNGPDPLAGERSGMLEGEADVVELPSSLSAPDDRQCADVPSTNTSRAERREPAPDRSGPDLAYMTRAERQRYVSAALDSACERIRGARTGERNETIFRQAVNIGRLVQSGYLDGDIARRRLIEAAEWRLDGESSEVEKARDSIQRGLFEYAQ